MADSDLEAQRLSHRHVANLSISFDQLHLTLHNGVSMSIRCKHLSRHHRISNDRARSQFTLSDDLQRIAWPKLGVTLQIDDILEKWLIHPGSGAPIADSPSSNASLEENLSLLEEAAEHDAMPEQAEQNPPSHDADSIAEREPGLLADLLARLERIESHLDLQAPGR